MEIYNTAQIKECEEYTILYKPIAAIDLMEKAAYDCFEWIKNKYSDEYTYYIICGKGNNGGDGLALARLLFNENYQVEVYIMQSSSDFSEEAKINFDKYPDSVYFLEKDEFEITDKKAVIIDALFGIGLNKNLQGGAEKIISKLNTINAVKIAIDIPSGLFADSLPEKGQTIFKADETLSFGFYKRSFLHMEAAKYVGNIHIFDIGFDPNFIKEEKTNNFIITNHDFIINFKRKDPFSNKGNFGKALLIGGSYGKMGSITLSTKAALRVGTGLVFTEAPEFGVTMLQTLAPEAMFISGGEKMIEKIEIPSEDCIIGIGPGLSKDIATKKALEVLLKKEKAPMVLDADALNIISENKNFLKLIPENSIITPHPKEFERLFGKTASTLEQCELARKKAQEHKIIIVLKGHNTAILLPDGLCYYNSTGNAGMAKGGSGDVLTGIITGMLAQDYDPVWAAILGVYIHGKAGDYAAKKYSEESMTAQNIIECLADVFLEVKN